MEPIYIEVRAEVRYWEDATINGQEDESGKLTPLRDGDCWAPVIRLSDGKVIGWPEGTEADIHFKVCDQGEYWLQDDQRTRVGRWNGYYVPDEFLCHGETGYGDYIIMKIGADGIVQGWRAPEVLWRSREDDDCGWLRISSESDATA